MTYGLLKSRCLNKEKSKIPYNIRDIKKFERDYKLVYRNSLYETKTNEQGGLVFNQKDLERFILTYSQRPELDEQIECRPINDCIETIIDEFFVFEFQIPLEDTSKIIVDNYNLYGLFKLNSSQEE